MSDVLTHSLSLLSVSCRSLCKSSPFSLISIVEPCSCSLKKKHSTCSYCGLVPLGSGHCAELQAQKMRNFLHSKRFCFFPGVLTVIKIWGNRKAFEEGRILIMQLGVSNFIWSTENKHVGGKKGKECMWSVTALLLIHFLQPKAPKLILFFVTYRTIRIRKNHTSLT